MKNRNFFILVITIMLFILSGCAAKSPLIRASSSGDSSTVQKLINEGANVNEADSRGYTPLMHAVWSRDVETVQVLLNKGVDVNAKDKNGYTALLWASSYGLNDIAKHLIAKDADVNVKGNDNSTPYLLAVQTNNTELAELLISKGADKDMEEIVSTTNILDEGKNINEPDRSGMTPLMHAVRSQNMAEIKTLIKNGANINIKDKSGYTALYYGACHNNYDIIKYLVDNGADVNAQDRSGLTVLHHIAIWKYDSLEIVDYLLSHNADTTIKEHNGWTVLEYSLYYKNVDMVASIRKKTNWEQDALPSTFGDTFDEILRSPSYYKPEKGMFDVPADKEHAYEIAVVDCNHIVVSSKRGLLLSTGVGYLVGLATDALSVKRRFINCMEKMGFECRDNCSK